MRKQLIPGHLFPPTRPRYEANAVPFCPIVHEDRVTAKSPVHSGVYHAVPFCPMVHEDKIDNEIIMLLIESGTL